MIKRCIAYGAAMLVILYTFLIYDAEVLSAILILSILYPILSLSWLALTRNPCGQKGTECQKWEKRERNPCRDSFKKSESLFCNPV